MHYKMYKHCIIQSIPYYRSPPRTVAHWPILDGDVTDSESSGIRHIPKSVGYLKSDHVRFEIFVSVQLYNYCGCYSRNKFE